MLFRNRVIKCRKCGRSISAKAVHFQVGFVQCNHPGCAEQNNLTTIYYDEAIMLGLPGFGSLVCQQTSKSYPFRAGCNVIGVSAEMATLMLPREQYTHEGKCYIGRQHCTINIDFDKRNGLLSYEIYDGGPATGGQYGQSMNGTFVNGKQLKSGEAEYLPLNAVIRLGYVDLFSLETYQIPETMLETYLRTDERDWGGTD